MKVSFYIIFFFSSLFGYRCIQESFNNRERPDLEESYLSESDHFIIHYDIEGNNQLRTAVNVLRRVKTRSDLLMDYALFYNYETKEGETADIIASKVYGSSKYHWVVCLMNNIIDPIFDFSLGSQEFEKYLEGKYGSLPRAQGTMATLHSPGGGTSDTHLPEYTIISSSTVTESQLRDPVDHGSLWWTIDNNGGENNTTRIAIPTQESIFANIEPGDTVQLLLPPECYNSDSLDYRKLAYASKQKVLGVYRGKRDDTSVPMGGFGNGSVHQVVVTDFDSSALFAFDDINLGGAPPDGYTYLSSGIHHFERDYYNENSGYLLKKGLEISAGEYLDSDIPISEKRIVFNADYEISQNENKRNLFMLRPEYLSEFVSEFEKLMRG